MRFLLKYDVVRTLEKEYLKIPYKIMVDVAREKHSQEQSPLLSRGASAMSGLGMLFKNQGLPRPGSDQTP
jgi:hypothetical protein